MRSKKRVLGCISALAILLGSIPMEMMNVEAEDTVGTTYYDVATTENLKLHVVTYDAEDEIYRRMDLDKAADIAKILKKDDPENGVETRQDYDFVKNSTDEDTGEVTHSFTNNVYSHAREAAGGRIRFSTNSANVSVKATLKNHFADYAKSMVDGKYGFDVYVDTTEGSTYAGTISVKTVPTQADPEVAVDVNVEGTITFDDATERNLTVYFPITIEVKKVEIGVDTGSTLGTHGISYEENEKILFYGSSITQGGAVTKPGNTYVNIVGRNLNMDYLNLGMWGSCKGQAEFAKYIAGLKDTEGFTAFVYDYDHNNRYKEHLEETHFRFYEIVREAYPDIPIIMITRPGNHLDQQHAEKPNDYTTTAETKEVIYNSYVKAILRGDENVHFIDGESFFGYAKGYLADNVHPNDAGQAKMAELVTAVLKQAYAGEKNLCVRPSNCEQLLMSEDFEDAVSGEVPSGWSQTCAGDGLVADSDDFSSVEDEDGNQVYQIQYTKTANANVTTHFGLTGTTPLSGASKFAIEMDATLNASTAGSFPYLGLRIGTGDSRANGYEVRVIARSNGCAVYFYDRTDNNMLEIDGVAIEDEQLAADFAEGVFDYHLRVESEHVITGNGVQQIAISVYVNDNTPVKGFFYPKVADFAPESIRLFMYPEKKAASGVQKVTMDNIKIYGYGHTLTLQNEEPATTEEEGTKAHYECSRCQKKYLDETGLIEVMNKDLVIPKIVPCVVLDEKFDNGDAWVANSTNQAEVNFGVFSENEGKYQLSHIRTAGSNPKSTIELDESDGEILTSVQDFTLKMDTVAYKSAESNAWPYLALRMYDDARDEYYEVRVQARNTGAAVTMYYGDSSGDTSEAETITDTDLGVQGKTEFTYNLQVNTESYVDADGNNKIKFTIYVNDNCVEFDREPIEGEWSLGSLEIYLFGGSKNHTVDATYKVLIDNLQIYTLTHPTEKMSATAAVPSEWGKAGTKEYHTCGVCGKEFLDAEGTILRTDANKNFAALNEIECQTRENNGLTDLRFVAYVDDYSQYSKVEFVVKSETADGNPTLDRTMECKSFYIGVVADDKFVNTGDVYGQVGTFAAIKIMNNTVEHLKENMTITVKWYGADGNVAKETTREICVFNEMPRQ